MCLWSHGWHPCAGHRANGLILVVDGFFSAPWPVLGRICLLVTVPKLASFLSPLLACSTSLNDLGMSLSPLSSSPSSSCLASQGVGDITAFYRGASLALPRVAKEGGLGTVAQEWWPSPLAMTVPGDPQPGGHCHKWCVKWHPQTLSLLTHEEIGAFTVPKNNAGLVPCPQVQTLSPKLPPSHSAHGDVW